MKIKITKSLLQHFLFASIVLLLTGCSNSTKKSTSKELKSTIKYPSQVIPFMNEWSILCGDGTSYKELALSLIHI